MHSSNNREKIIAYLQLKRENYPKDEVFKGFNTNNNFQYQSLIWYLQGKILYQEWSNRSVIITSHSFQNAQKQGLMVLLKLIHKYFA